jgi:hypothetical protein
MRQESAYVSAHAKLRAELVASFKHMPRITRAYNTKRHPWCVRFPELGSIRAQTFASACLLCKRYMDGRKGAQ